MTTSARVAFLMLFAVSTARAQEHGGPEQRGPRPEMLDACKAKKAGDSCEVTLPYRDHKATGKCAALPDGKLFCHVPPPPEMLKACEGKKEGDACSASLEGRKLEGSCRKGRMDAKLICRPSRGGGGGGPH